MAKTLERTDPRFSRKDDVRVEEEGIRPWEGIVTAVKWSPVSGWWLEVRRGDEGTYVVHESMIEAV